MSATYNGKTLSVPQKNTVHIPVKYMSVEGDTPIRRNLGIAIDNVEDIPNTPYCKMGDKVYLKKDGRIQRISNARHWLSHILPDEYQTMTELPVKIVPAKGTDKLHLLFNGCSKLTSIDAFNTKGVKDMRWMFKNCSELLAGPNIDMSDAEDLEGAFSGCKKMTSVPAYDTSRAKDVSEMFMDCSALTSAPDIDLSAAENVTGFLHQKTGEYSGSNGKNNKITSIPLYDISSARQAGHMFEGLTALVEMPLLDTSNVENFDCFVSRCSSLTSFPVLDTSKAKSLNSMFSGCTGLTSAPVLSLAAAESIRNMFSDCSSLTALPALDTSGVKYLQGVFNGCKLITETPAFDLSAAVDTSEMFSSCEALATVPQMNTSHVKRMDYMFENCKTLPATFPWTIDASNCESMRDIFRRSTVTEVTIANASEELRAKDAQYFKDTSSNYGGDPLTIHFI